MAQDDAIAHHVEALDRLITAACADALPPLIGELARLQALAFARLTSSATPTAPVADEGDRLLTDLEAAAMLALTPEQLRRRRTWPFRKKLGNKTVRYSERGIQKFLARKTS